MGGAKRSFVTGATGFVGGRLVARLRELGHEVTALARAGSDTGAIEKLGVAVHRGDLRDPACFSGSLRGMDYVFHIGDIAVSDPGYIEGSRRVAETLATAARGPAIRRLVFVSSMSVVFTPPDGVVTEETGPVRPLEDRYHTAKRLAERLLLESGAPVSVVRPLWIYGPGCRWMVPVVRAAIAAGPIGLPFPGTADFTMATIHIDDLADALVRAAKVENCAARVFHVHDDGDCTIAGFMEELGRCLGRPIHLRFPPLALQQALAAVVDRTRLLGRQPNASHIVRGFSTHRRFSNQRMKRELGLTLRYPTPRDGMPSFAGWLGPRLGRAGAPAGSGVAS